MKKLGWILISFLLLGGSIGFFIYAWRCDTRSEQSKLEGAYYTDEVDIHEVDIHELASKDLVPSIDVRYEQAEEPKLEPYNIRWYQVKYYSGTSQWRAYLYVPVGTGKAVKDKLESLDFVDGVIIRNSLLYEKPKDDRLEVELSKRANKSHTERLNAILADIVDAAERGL